MMLEDSLGHLKVGIIHFWSEDFTTLITDSELNVAEQEAFLKDAEQMEKFINEIYILLDPTGEEMPIGLRSFWPIVRRDLGRLRYARTSQVMIEEVERRLGYLKKYYGDIDKIDGTYCLSNLKLSLSETRGSFSYLLHYSDEIKASKEK
jgi:hypothetical protein